MKYKIIIFWLSIILFSSCANENNNTYKVLVDSMFPHLTLIDDKGNEIMHMNFYDDGTFVSFEVTDRNEYFTVIFNFDTNSINSYAVSDRLSDYGSSTMFYPDERSKLFRIERFGKLGITEHILNDGNVIIQTSNVDDYMQEEDYMGAQHD